MFARPFSEQILRKCLYWSLKPQADWLILIQCSVLSAQCSVLSAQ
ncbi:hypothetical protein GCWU000341_00485 [Oribacterium sp. oral taxon 078 str. F0262]|nr:hypothetical protein GCWU000341_00485 [Oribacterium sp. oral taxon 078 str. F0262]